MTAPELLQALRSAGVELHQEAQGLRVKGPMTPGLQLQVRRLRMELLMLLATERAAAVAAGRGASDETTPCELQAAAAPVQPPAAAPVSGGQQEASAPPDPLPRHLWASVGVTWRRMPDGRHVAMHALGEAHGQGIVDGRIAYDDAVAAEREARTARATGTMLGALANPRAPFTLDRPPGDRPPLAFDASALAPPPPPKRPRRPRARPWREPEAAFRSARGHRP